MFINIEVKGATNILISVPSDKSEKALPAIINMLERNAVFIKDNWSSLEKVMPDSTIILGDSYKTKSNNHEIEYKVEAKDHVIEGFEPASKELFISFADYKKTKDEHIGKLNAEIAELKEKNANLTKKIDALINCNDTEEINRLY